MSLLINIEKADKNDDNKLDSTELAQLIKNNKALANLNEEEILQIFDEVQTYTETKDDESTELELEDLEALIDELSKMTKKL